MHLLTSKRQSSCTDCGTRRVSIFEEKKFRPFRYANNFVLKGTFSQDHRKMPVEEEAMFQSNICIDSFILMKFFPR